MKATKPERFQPRFVLSHFTGHGRLPNAVYHDALERDAALAPHCTVIYARASHCPRCSQLLQQEPGAGVCKWGCGRIWRIVGSSGTEQYEYERASGLTSADRDDGTAWAIE